MASIAARQVLRIPTNVDTDLTAYCDSRDLLATAEISRKEVTVYRLHGEVAFYFQSQHRITALRWKNDGSLLAVACTDSTISLHSRHDGKLLYRMPAQTGRSEDDWFLDLTHIAESNGAPVHSEDLVHSELHKPWCVGWTAHVSSPQYTKEHQLRNGENESTERIFDDEIDALLHDPKTPTSNGKHGICVLSGAITTLDTTKDMPSLSRIETPQGMKQTPESNKFSNQAGTDAIFKSAGSTNTEVSTLLVSSSSGGTEVFLDESIRVGHFDRPHEPVLHASNTVCNAQVILARGGGHSPAHGEMHLEYLVLPLERLSSPSHHVYTRNTKRVQDLAQYVTHTVRCIQHEFETGSRYPDRLLANLFEDGYDSLDNDTAVQNGITELTLLCITGNFTPPILEWLKDSVKEAGHKRWNTFVNTIYSRIESLLFKNLLPALDQLSIAAITLRGHARFQTDHTTMSTFPVDASVFSDLDDAVDALRLAASRMQLIVAEEQKQFKSFSKWLRVQIDIAVAGAGPGTKYADEIADRELPNVDHALCLRFIQRTMCYGQLREKLRSDLLDSTGPFTQEVFFKHPVVLSLTRSSTMAALQNTNTSLDPRPPGSDSLPPGIALNLTLLTAMLNARTRLSIHAIAAWQSKTIPEPTTIRIPEQHVPNDSRIWALRISPTEVVEALVSCPQEQSAATLSLVRVTRQRDGPLTPEIDHLTLPLPPGGASPGPEGTILHAAFAGPQHILVLHQQRSVDDPMQTTPQGPTDLLLVDIQAAERGVRHEGSVRSLHAWETSMTDNSGSLVPKHFIVGGRPGKKVILCTLHNPAGSSGETYWQILDWGRGVEDLETGRGDEDEDMVGN